MSDFPDERVLTPATSFGTRALFHNPGKRRPRGLPPLRAIAWIFLKGPDLPSGALALAATAFWVATARYEERFNIARFGVAYSEYMKRTKMFIPFLL